MSTPASANEPHTKEAETARLKGLLESARRRGDITAQLHLQSILGSESDPLPASANESPAEEAEPARLKQLLESVRRRGDATAQLQLQRILASENE